MTVNDHDSNPLVFLDADMSEPLATVLGSRSAVFWCARCPGKTGANEDAMALISLLPGRAVLIVADGFGGQPAGDRAAGIAVNAMLSSIRNSEPERDLRDAILDGFEAANREVLALELGAATTLAVVELDGDMFRPYHVGDSDILVVGQRGKRKYQTIAHSPVGHAVEAGFIEPDEALHHEDRHFVSNMVGAPEMRIDVGPRLELKPRDTLIVGTDGIFDNLSVEEVVDCIRKGPLKRCANQIISLMRSRMNGEENTPVGKPDDSSFVLLRLLPS
ncbi:MAG: PP2C family protein-serine/threonine phosphatase [Planctomycetota bacterium]|jgi:serine/threonine protein phosphatase PrpC